MNRTREQIEQRLRDDASAWTAAVQGETTKPAPRPVHRPVGVWALAASLGVAALVASTVWLQRPDDDDPKIVQHDPVSIPAIRLPALPQARPVPMWTTRQLLDDTVRAVEEPYHAETQRLAADVKRALVFLREAVPVPATRGG